MDFETAITQGERIGFYICHCGINIASKVRCSEVAEFIGRLPGVVISRDYLFMCSDPGQELIEKDVAEHGLTRVVVASCSPRMHELTFRAACARAGLNPFRAFHHVCVREHVSWVHTDMDEATEKAKALCMAGVYRVRNQSPLSPKTFPVNTNTLIVGGGIAGMQAALDIAKAGYKAFVVERQPTIGGHMLQYDKTFPTLDCAACIGTPKMVSVGQSPNIELLSCAEVEEVSGFVGNFQVKVREHARYVDVDKCTGCGECAEKCPVSFPNEWDEGTLPRKAIYRPFPQAVPITFTIDKRGVPACQDACPIETRAQGYVNLVAQGRFREAIDVVRSVNPMPGVLGRVCHHPCESACQRGQHDDSISICGIKRFLADWELENGGLPEPEVPEKNGKRVAVVGAGPSGLFAGYDLSKKGYGVTIFEQLPVAGGLLRTGIPAFRLPRDVLEREIQWIVDHGVELRLGEGIGSERGLDDLFGDGFDAVVLALGTTKSRQLNITGEQLEGVVGCLEYLRATNLKQTMKTGSRVAVIGGGNAAMDSARTALREGADEVTVVYRRTRAEMPAVEAEIEEAIEEGVKFYYLAAPIEVVGESGRVTALRCIAMELDEPDESGRRRPVPVEGSELDLDVDMVIPAISQSPDLDVLGGETDLLITRWGTLRVDEVTCETGREAVFACGDAVNGPGTVVFAAASGRKAASAVDCYLSGLGYDELNVIDERPRVEDVGLGDRVLKDRVHPEKSPEASPRSYAEVDLALTEEQVVEEASRCLTCGGCCDCRACVDACEAKAIDHSMQDRVRTLDIGSIIIATGFNVMNPTGLEPYGYGRYPNVVNNLEFERLSNATGPTKGQILLRDPKDRYNFTRPPRSVAILHCIGSRDANAHEYCSRTCCMYALKFAHLIKDKCGHETEVYNFYIDMRCFGKGYEEFYKRVQDEGVRMIRGKATEVVPSDEPDEKGMLAVRAEDTLAGRLLRVPVEMVILCSAMEARADALQVARTFGISVGQDGFFIEEHPKLEPVSTPTSGVFLAGTCQGPKDIPDTVAQAKGAASEALALSARGEVTVSPMTSHIDPDICIGCRVCIDLCPYSAIDFDERHQVSVVNEAVCKGCGSCAGYCPSGAASIRHFTHKQVFAELDGLLP